MARILNDVEFVGLWIFTATLRILSIIREVISIEFCTYSLLLEIFGHFPTVFFQVKQIVKQYKSR